MSTLITNAESVLRKLNWPRDRKLKCRICNQDFSPYEASIATCQVETPEGKAVFHFDHECRSCWTNVSWDIRENGTLTKCSCSESVLDALRPHVDAPFSPREAQ
jgi:hypothetical protein